MMEVQSLAPRPVPMYTPAVCVTSPSVTNAHIKMCWEGNLKKALVHMCSEKF